MTNRILDNDILHIGFDDTDSVQGRCTTHLAYQITYILLNKYHSKFIDFPLLIRLNPNIPLKTRGNGSVCLRIKGRNYEQIKEEIVHIIEKYSDLKNGANPGIVFYEANNIGEELKAFSNSAMDTVLSKQFAEKIAQRNRVKYQIFGKGHGIVGALAAIGNALHNDHTFETIAYRKQENLGTYRKVEEYKVKKLDKDSFPFTYNNFDFKNNRVLISPHGPDPVFCGIRGEDPTITTLFLKNLQINEDLDGYMIFRSNQGTNQHLNLEKDILKILPFTSGYIKCQVVTKPITIRGGHIIFYVTDSSNNKLPVAVYEPTRLTKIAYNLEIGDKVTIGFGTNIKSNNQKTLNLEYLEIRELVKVFEIRNPICSSCNKSMKSEGKNKGFQCIKCKIRKRECGKENVEKRRTINCGLYIPELIAHRHLTKPYCRYGLEKTHNKKGLEYLLKNVKWFEKSSGGLI